MVSTPRECSLCHTGIPPSEMGRVVSANVKFYDIYTRDVGNPSYRRRHLYCPACTSSFIEWTRSRIVEPERVDD